MDDLKISHADHRQVTKMIKWIERRYRKMQVSRGKLYSHLGMVLDYSTPGEVKVDMIKYIKDTVEIFIELISGVAATPAASHLSNVNAYCVKLVEQLARVFHTTTAKLLFLCKRAPRHTGANSISDHKSERIRRG